MKTALTAYLLLSGIAAAFLIYLNVRGIDVVTSVATLLFWASAPFLRPLPRPLDLAHTAIGVALLVAFAYFAALRILAVLKI
jgi:hypothetical protein